MLAAVVARYGSDPFYGGEFFRRHFFGQAIGWKFQLVGKSPEFLNSQKVGKGANRERTPPVSRQVARGRGPFFKDSAGISPKHFLQQRRFWSGLPADRHLFLDNRRAGPLEHRPQRTSPPLIRSVFLRQEAGRRFTLAVLPGRLGDDPDFGPVFEAVSREKAGAVDEGLVVGLAVLLAKVYRGSSTQPCIPIHKRQVLLGSSSRHGFPRLSAIRSGQSHRVTKGGRSTSPCIGPENHSNCHFSRSLTLG